VFGGERASDHHHGLVVRVGRLEVGAAEEGVHDDAEFERREVHAEASVGSPAEDHHAELGWGLVDEAVGVEGVRVGEEVRVADECSVQDGDPCSGR
jgi:hypothetical protein